MDDGEELEGGKRYEKDKDVIIKFIVNKYKKKKKMVKDIEWENKLIELMKK